DHAEALGLEVDVVVGDLDSVSSSALANARAGGARVDEHPAEKDATDLELALDEAVAAGATEIVVVGGHGGRLDHLLANCALLASPRYADVTISGYLGEARVFVVHGGAEPCAVHGTVGE